MLRRILSTVLALALLAFSFAAFSEEAVEEEKDLGFRAIPGMTCFPLTADNEDTPGRFILDAPMEWDGGDCSEVYGIPGVMAIQDTAHIVLVCEVDAMQQLIMTVIYPDHPLSGFIGEGQSVVRGESTEGSRILETFDLHGLKATKVEMVGQGFEMIWIEDNEDLWFFMYPTDPADREYTETVAGMVDSFTVFHPDSVGDAPAEDFEVTEDGDGVAVTAYKGNAAYVHIPAQISGKPVTRVADKAFYETDVREATFPDTVTELGSFLFGGCTELVTVTLPAHLKTLPDGTFESCFRLFNAELNEELMRIEESAFWGNNYLFSLTLPDSLEEIEEQNFIMAGILSYFVVGEDSAGFRTNEEGTILFTKDGKRLLHYGMNNEADTYDVPEGVESIDPYAFYDVAQLKTVSFPESLRTIGGMALALTGIRELTIPAGVTEIGVLNNVTVEGSDATVAYVSVGNETTVRGVPGSAAEAYAQRMNKTFIPVEGNASAE